MNKSGILVLVNNIFVRANAVLAILARLLVDSSIIMSNVKD